MRSQRGFLAGAPTGFPGPTAIRSMSGGPSLEFQMQCARGRIPESYFVVGKTRSSDSLMDRGVQIELSAEE
jgi:hypothetical protein